MGEMSKTIASNSQSVSAASSLFNDAGCFLKLFVLFFFLWVMRGRRGGVCGGVLYFTVLTKVRDSLDPQQGKNGIKYSGGSQKRVGKDIIHQTRVGVL